MGFDIYADMEMTIENFREETASRDPAFWRETSRSKLEAKWQARKPLLNNHSLNILSCHEGGIQSSIEIIDLETDVSE